jgi:hypothetical protein
MFNATTKVRVCDYLATQMFNNFMPQPLATVTQMHTQWFSQDAAWSHIVVVLDFLHETFGERMCFTVFHSATSVATSAHLTAPI